ncbi:MAG: tetratricopeptide repeat protein [Candidatus Margulisiibacteriota bacterium]|nr:tetratricopeptide repeat protein [Candidatus Margulisiibacteriota bacterium]
MEDAIKGYKKVLELCPQQILARNHLAEAFLYRKRIDEALLEFENIVRIDPSAADNIVVKCREIIKGNPKLLLARLVLGRAYLIKNDLQRAAMEGEGIVNIDNKFTAAYLLLGEVYFRMKLCRKAVGALRTAMSMEPYNNLVLEEYRVAMERELEMEIESKKGRIKEDQWMISLHLDLAKLYIKKGLKEETIRELQIAAKDQARAAYAYELMGRIYRKDGRLDLAAGQFAKAKEVLSDQSADFEKTITFNLGTACEGEGDIQKALDIYEGVLQEDIDFGNLAEKIEYLKSSSLHSLRDKALLAVVSNPLKGEIVAAWGREGKAVHRGKSEVMSVSFGQNYNTSGFEYFIKGMYKAAAEEFSLAVQLDSNFAVGLNNLGITLAKEGKLAEAKMRLENAIHLYPGSAVIRNNLGVIYLLLKDIEKSRIELEAALAIDPKLCATCINLGDAYYFKGDIEKAVRLYSKVGNFDLLTDIANQRLLYKIP